MSVETLWIRSKARLFLKTTLAALACAGLVSCGGNGGSTATPVVVTPPPPPPPAPTGGTTQTLENAWSDPATWGGQPPQAGDYVVIEEGETVMLDTDTPPLIGLAVKGTLIGYDGGPISITSDFIAVEGRLEIGTADDPFENEAVITLTGEDGRETPYSGVIGNRALGVFGTGELSLHSVSGEKTAWTQITSSIQPGDTTFSTVDFVDWEPGDKIVIAPTGFDPLEAEEVEVVSANGSTVTFSPAAAFPHLGLQQSYEGKTLDMRAEVGLLSRNIRIQGAEDSEFFRDPETDFTAGFGAHSIFRDDAKIAIDGVEFTRTGQSGKPGRYAAHWHLAGDQNGDYIRDTSVHHSFQRAIVMHQSNFVTAEDNVAYFVGNHAFIPAEDGNEDGNVFRRNLSVLNYTPREEDFAFKAKLAGNTEQGEHRSSGFWMRSANQVFEGNHVAGSHDGMGFFFDQIKAVDNTATSPLVFTDNLAHSIHREDTGFANGLTYRTSIKGIGLMVDENTSDADAELSDFTAYANFGGLWLEDRNITARDMVLSDNGVGAFVMKSVLDDVVIVGESEQGPGTPPKAGSTENFSSNWSAAVHAPPSHGQERAPVLKGVTVVDQKDVAFFYNRIGIEYGAEVQKLTVKNTPNRAMFAEKTAFKYHQKSQNGVLDDPTGQLAGDGRAVRWTLPLSNIVTDDCRYNEAVQAFACDPEDSVRIRFDATRRDTPAWIVQTDSGAVTQTVGRFRRWSFLNSGKVYEAWWNSNENVPDVLNIEVTKALGKSGGVAFPVSGRPASVTQDGASVAAANSRAAFDAASGSAHFHDAAAGLLYVKFAGGEAYDLRIEAPFTSGEAPVAAAPATDAGATVQGLAFTTYAQGTDAIRSRPSALGSARQSGTTDGPGRDFAAEPDTAIVYQGYIDAPSTGIYTFGVNTDLHADVYINDKWVTGRRVQSAGGSPTSGLRQRLQEGLHPVTIVLSQPEGRNRDPEFAMIWKSPGDDANDPRTFATMPDAVFRRAR